MRVLAVPPRHSRSFRSAFQSAYETDPAKVGKALPASEEAKRVRKMIHFM